MIDLIKLYFSRVKILAQRPTHISAVATALLIAKTFIGGGRRRGEGRGGEDRGTRSIATAQRPERAL